MAEEPYDQGHTHATPNIIAWFAVKAESFPERSQRFRPRKVSCCKQTNCITQNVSEEISETASIKKGELQIQSPIYKKQHYTKNQNHSHAFPCVSRRPMVIWKGRIECVLVGQWINPFFA